MTSTFKKLKVTKLTSNFRDAIKIVESPLPTKLEANQVLVKNAYAGVNATDINISAGRYFTDGKLPFDIGLEGVGVVEKVADGSKLKPGDPVLCIRSCGYSEYLVVPENQVVPLPNLDPKYIVASIVGLTAAIGLDEAGRIKAGDKVLITAAAGGTGHICVQWAKAKGCHVIGTCSSQAKVDLLKSIGCDRVINYKEEKIDQVLTKEYPDGVDVIWETIGGDTFKMLFNHLAKKGRLVIVGGITGYKEVGFPDVQITNLPGKLLMGSKSLIGFLLFDYESQLPEYIKKLVTMIAAGQLKVFVDDGSAAGTPFHGIEKAVDAVEHLHSGRNVGKVVVKLSE